MSVLHIPTVHTHDVSKQISREKNFPSGWKCYKTIGSYVSCAFIKIWSTREVWRALKKLELPSAMPQATLTHLSCSPNFPHASYLDKRTLMYEPIVNLINKLETCFLTLLNPKIFRKSSSLHIHRKFFSKHLSPTVKNCFQNWKAHLLKFCRSARKVGYWCSALITSWWQRFACLYCKKI